MLRLRRRLGDNRELNLRAKDGRIPVTIAELSSHFKIVPATLIVRFVTLPLPCEDGYVQLPSTMQPGGRYDLSVEGERQPRIKSTSAGQIPLKAADDAGDAGMKRAHFTYKDTAMQERYDFLAFGIVPEHILSETWEIRRSFKNNIRQRFSLSVDDGRLMAYKQDPEKFKSVGAGVYGLTHPLRLVLFDDAEAEAIVRARHARGHDRKNRLRAILTRHYKHTGICAVIDRVLGACNVCAEMTSNIEIPTVAIMTQRPHELIMFDIFFVGFTTSEGYTCVLLIKDHFTKFLWAKPLQGKSAAPIADFLFQLFVDGRPCPERWHCDNGGEFVNKLMLEVIELLMAKYTHGRPRHPQTQGSIERANGTVKRKLLAWCRENQPVDLTGETIVDWADQLAEIVRNENDAPSKLYGLDPFFLQFGTPRALGEGGVHPTPTQVEAIRLHCIRCQEAYAGKINKFPEYEATYEIGDIVNVWATPKDLKDRKALTVWSAKGVVEQNRGGYHNYYRVRWITSGLHTMRTHKDDTGTRRRATPGTLSMWVFRGHLKLVPTAPSGASDVFIDTDGNALFVLFRFDDGSFNYVFVGGQYEGQEYLCTNENDDLASCWRVPYATWVHNTLEGLPLHTPCGATVPPRSVDKKRRHKNKPGARVRPPKAAALPRNTNVPRTPAPAPPRADAPEAPCKPQRRPCSYSECRIFFDDPYNPMCPCPIKNCPQVGHLQCYRDYVTKFFHTSTILHMDLPHTYICDDHLSDIVDYYKESESVGRPAVNERFPLPQPKTCAYGEECLHVDVDLNLCTAAAGDGVDGMLAHDLVECDLGLEDVPNTCTAVGHGNCYTHYLERTYTFNENFHMALREWGWATFACPRCVDSSATALLQSEAKRVKSETGLDMLLPGVGFPMKPMHACYPMPRMSSRRGAQRSTSEINNNVVSDGTTYALVRHMTQYQSI
jgi:transposase InsO family protein